MMFIVILINHKKNVRKKEVKSDKDKYVHINRNKNKV